MYIGYSLELGDDLEIMIEYVNEAGEVITYGGPQYHVKGGWSLDPAQIYLGFTRLLYPFLCGLIISRILPKRSTAENPSGSPIRLKGGFIWTSLILITILSVPCISGQDGVANGLYQAMMILVAFPILVLMGAGSTIKSPALAKVCKEVFPLKSAADIVGLNEIQCGNPGLYAIDSTNAAMAEYMRTLFTATEAEELGIGKVYEKWW